MSSIITAQKRIAGHATQDRAEGRIPAILYGSGIEPVSLSVDPLTFERLYKEAGESTLIDFTIEGQSEPTKVLIQDVQFDSLKDRFTHVDFRQVNMSQEMHATVELRFIGEAPAVKALGGTLNMQREDVEVKCLPKDLVNHIDVDITVLTTFDDAIHIKDLPVPTGVTIVEHGDGLVAKVLAPLSEDALKAMEESQVGDVTAIEIEKKKEGEDAEAGEEKKEEKKDEKKK